MNFAVAENTAVAAVVGGIAAVVGGIAAVVVDSGTVAGTSCCNAAVASAAFCGTVVVRFAAAIVAHG